MKFVDEVQMLDTASRTAVELGQVIRHNIPTECRIALLDALLVHMGTKLHSSELRLFRTFEAGLVRGIGDDLIKRTLELDRDSSSGNEINNI